MRNLFPEPPLLSYRRPRNLKDHLVRAKQPNQTRTDTETFTGCQSCTDKRCFSCNEITRSDTFRSTVTKRVFKILGNNTCKSKNAIYLIECTACHIQYVGETQNQVSGRINQHRSSANDLHTSFPVGVHFNQSGRHHTWEDMTFTVIECNPTWTGKKRKEREAFWIHNLRTLQPDGLNINPGLFT
jgi:hypothetical protein